MTRTVAVLLLLLAAAPAPACTFCAGNLLGRPTLRERTAQATTVVIGRLSNPRFDAAAGGGRTDFTPNRTLKSDPARPFPRAAWTVVPHAFSHRRHLYHVFRFRPIQETEVDVRTAVARVEDPERDGVPAWTQAAWVTPGAAGQRSLPAAQRAILRSLLAAEGG